MQINNINLINRNSFYKINYKKTPLKKQQTLCSKNADNTFFINTVTPLYFGKVHKKNITSSKPKKLPEHINFKDAKTIDQATDFGVNTLGIKEYIGFRKKDLDIMNWANEGIVIVSNKSKGKVVMPRKIILEKMASGAAGVNQFGDLLIDKNGIDNIKHYFSRVEKLFIEDSNSFNLPEEIFKNNLSLIKKGKLLIKHMDTIIGKDNFEYSGSIFSQISHEMGHIQHFKNLNSDDLFFELGCYDLSKIKRSAEGLRIWDLFGNNKDTVSKVSKYALTNPAEFIAECYAQMIDGIKLDDDVIDLYKKLGGVMLN